MNINKDKSKRQENRIRKSFAKLGKDAKTTLGSGSLWFQKGDVMTEDFLIEAKTKVKPSKSISLKKEWFDKIYNEAFTDNKIGLLVFSFGDGNDIVSLSQEDFLNIILELYELRGKDD